MSSDKLVPNGPGTTSHILILFLKHETQVQEGYWLAASQASIQSLYTSTGSDRYVMGVWNSSKQTEHDIIPVFLLLSILTSHDFSWLQNGQVNWESRSPVIFFLGGGFLFDLRRPITVKLTHVSVSEREEKHKAALNGRKHTTGERKNNSGQVCLSKVSRLVLACLLLISCTT